MEYIYLFKKIEYFTVRMKKYILYYYIYEKILY